MLQRRVSDPAMLWLVEQFLRAGVIVDGRRLDTERGTPQGGVISPLLANIYLHHVLDEWFARAVQPQCRGAAHLVRYADDFVILCQNAPQAQAALEEVKVWVEENGLTLHPDKTHVGDCCVEG